MINKQENSVPYELKPRNIQRYKWPLNCYFKDTEEKTFCIISWRVMKNVFGTIIRSAKKNHDAGQAKRQNRQQSPIFMALSSYFVFGRISWMKCIMTNPTKLSLGNATNNKWCNWAEHWSKNGQIYTKRTTKWSSRTTKLGLMLLLRSPYSPDIVPSDYYLFRSMTHDFFKQCFHSYEDTKKWINSWTIHELAMDNILNEAVLLSKNPLKLMHIYTQTHTRT